MLKEKLAVMVDQAGSLRRLARVMKVSYMSLYKILHGQQNIGRKLAWALGYRYTVVFEPIRRAQR